MPKLPGGTGGGGLQCLGGAPTVVPPQGSQPPKVPQQTGWGAFDAAWQGHAWSSGH